MNKYPNGYYPKLQYYSELLLEAVKNEDIFEVDRIHDKLTYFIGKQAGLQMAEDQKLEEQAHQVWYYTNNL